MYLIQQNTKLIAITTQIFATPAISWMYTQIWVLSSQFAL